MTAPPAGRRLTKNEKRKLRKKLEKSKVVEEGDSAVNMQNGDKIQEPSEHGLEDVDVEYVGMGLEEQADGVDSALLGQFAEIFQKFSASGNSKTEAINVETETNKDVDDLIDGILEESKPKKMSKRARKLASRLSVAQLKQLVDHPESVEAHDVCSSDPRFLIFLKSLPNTVHVPRHWCLKRKYLQGKRGVERPAFQLPDFIADTGIAKIRESVLEQEKMKKARQKAKDKLKPKMGKIDIDYQVLHDAFFKFQKKPPLTGFGELYYEGREFEVDSIDKVPGKLSEALRLALGMTDNMPLPWLVNMQRYGPPPFYPSLKIRGLNAPIPAGCSFGYQAGQYGKPPVDEYGRPLYGDVFGAPEAYEDEAVDRTYFGEMQEEEEEEEEDEEEEEEDEAVADGEQGASASDEAGRASVLPEGATSTITTAEYEDSVMDLRKRLAGTSAGTTAPAGGQKELYQVVRETAAGSTKDAGQLFGSDRTYLMPPKDGVEMAINPDQLEQQLEGMGDKTILEGTYKDIRRAEAEAGGRKEFEIDDPASKRKRKAEESISAKRFKDYKF
jgi:splicing factor 3B subunit 2